MTPSLARTLTAALGAAALLAPAAASAQQAARFDAGGEASMLARINAMRSANDLPPLVRSEALDRAARAQSEEMARRNALSHVSPSGGTPADRVRAAGVAATTVAENVALHRSADDAQAALVASDAHRGNMLDPHMNHVGLAALVTERGIYVTQLFAAIPAPAPEPAVVPQLPAPSVQRVGPAEAAAAEAPRITVAPRASTTAPPVEAPDAAPEARRVEPARLALAPGAGGTVVVQRSPDTDRVRGYWVYSQRRWWYFPMPPGARPGQQLQADLSRTGPPPGYPAHPDGAAAPTARAVPAVPPPRAFVPRGPVVARPFRAPGSVVIQGNFFGPPPPPMIGRPSRAWRIANRRWRRAYRRWLRAQRRARRLSRLY